jgi:L-alanine-DL-glutamate epimerase-like enolase superfamily enzyme
MDWGQDLLMDPLEPAKGFIAPRDTPGTGVDWNEKAIAPLLLQG